MSSIPYSGNLLTASNRLEFCCEMALRTESICRPRLKDWSHGSSKTDIFTLFSKPNRVIATRGRNISVSINMAARQSDDSRKINFDVKEQARQFWDNSPQPIKRFPWNRTFENFIQLIIDLTLAVVKYLSVPLLAVSSLSEMSYCAHERKLFLVPFWLLVGSAVAGILKETALELSSLQDAEVPWHLISIAVFFTLLKLPGPYYPYWGRIFIPHIANGGLLRTLWFAFMWYRAKRA